MSVITARVGNDQYPVIVSKGAIHDLLVFCESFSKRNVLVVADNYFSTADLSSYKGLDTLLDSFPCLFIDGGVESKGITGYQKVIEWVILQKLPRDGVIIAIGGGVIGDLVAFVASTYLRGVNLVHLPTTTTSMIDSAIGGKTGLNFDQQVNSIGTYYNPIGVFMDISFLMTLEERDYNAGICEAIKMSLTGSSEKAYKFLSNKNKLSATFRCSNELIELIIWSVKMKLFHVSDDAKEKNIRLILNYGHTFGQAIETHFGLQQDHLRHGEAVALGLISASSAIHLLEGSSDTALVKSLTRELMTTYNLPVCIPSAPDIAFPSPSLLVKNLINDKKRTSKGNRFILTPKLGIAEIRYISNEQILEESFAEVF